MTRSSLVAAELARHDFERLSAEYKRRGWKFHHGYPSAAELRDRARSLLLGVTEHGPVTSARMTATCSGGTVALRVEGLTQC